jgi:hypothetical protein
MKPGGHFFDAGADAHKKLGFAAVLVGLLQPLNALFRGKKPAAGESASAGRRAWQALHRGAGYFAIAAGVFNCTSGIGHVKGHMYADDVRWAWATLGTMLGGLALALAAVAGFCRGGAGDHELKLKSPLGDDGKGDDGKGDDDKGLDMGSIYPPAKASGVV